MKMLVLLGAILFEVIATTSLKMSYGFTKLIPSLVTVIGYFCSFYLLSLALKSFSLGTAYAIWSGLGTAITVIVGVILWHESVSLPRIIGILLVIIGVIVLNMAESLPVEVHQGQ